MKYFRFIIIITISILIVACTTTNQNSGSSNQSKNLMDNTKKSTNDSNSDLATNKIVTADKIAGSWNLKYDSKSEQVTIVITGNTLKWQSPNLTVNFNVSINKDQISGSSNYNDSSKLKITLKLLDDNKFSGVLESIANENGKEYIKTYNLIGTR